MNDSGDLFSNNLGMFIYIYDTKEKQLTAMNDSLYDYF